MRKDKRGMALITAIAVLALMLILFGGLAMIYSSQVSRNKLEHEQSQAMLLAQSYTEMLNQVLESPATENEFKMALGEITTGRETEIKSQLDFSDTSDQVKIVATADRRTTGSNSTSRSIKIKVTATVNGETRSIISDYTYLRTLNSFDLSDYALYGNQIINYDKTDAQSVIFDHLWYAAIDSSEEIDLDELYNRAGYQQGRIDNQNNRVVFNVIKNEAVKPESSEDESAGEDSEAPDNEESTAPDYFAFADNGAEQPINLPEWEGLAVPADAKECSFSTPTTTISESCIWQGNTSSRINIKAKDADIILYMPIYDEGLVLENASAVGTQTINFDGGGQYRLFIYVYPVGGSNSFTIDASVLLTSSRTGNEPSDIYLISNDALDVSVESTLGSYNKIEAFLYFPNGTVHLDKIESRQNDIHRRIEGSLIADKITLNNADGSGKRNLRFVMEYVRPDRKVLESAGLISESNGSDDVSETITFYLNGYEEGGK